MQKALEKLESEKNTCDEKNIEIHQLLQETQKENSLLKDKNVKYQTCFGDIVRLSIPDVKKITTINEDSSDITVRNISNLLEKVFLLNNKEREMLQYQVSSLNNKIEENNKIHEERLVYEKKLIETQYKESQNLQSVSMSSKDREFQKLTEDLNALRDKMKATEEFHKKEVAHLEDSLRTNEENRKLNIEKLQGENQRLQCSVLQLEQDLKNNDIERTNISKDSLALQEKFNILTDDLNLKNKCVMALEKEVVQFKDNVTELESSILSLKTSSEADKVHFNKEISMKNEQSKEFLKKENELKERFSLEAANIENKVRDEEQIKYENDIREINLVIENYKSVLDEAKSDIDEKNQIIMENNEHIVNITNELHLLQKQFDDVNVELLQAKNKISLKESQVLSLHVDLEDVRIKLKDSCDKENAAAELLENANKTISSHTKHISSLEKNKLELIQSVETSTFKSEFIQQEWDKILAAVNGKNEELQAVHKEKKMIARKLKEKHELHLSKEVECGKLKEEVNKLKLQIMNTEKDYNSLKKDYGELRLGYENTIDEKNALEAVVGEQEDVKEKELAKLMKRLHGSEHDLVMLNRLIKNHKRSDSKGDLLLLLLF